MSRPCAAGRGLVTTVTGAAAPVLAVATVLAAGTDRTHLGTL
jgi:hypothetical protein